MNQDQIKAMADQQRLTIEAFQEKAKKMSTEDINKELAKRIEQNRPMHEARVKMGLEMMVLSKEARLRLIRQNFPGIRVEEVVELCELLPSDHVLGDTEQWVERIKKAGLNPTRLLVDKTRMVIRLLE